MRALRLIGLLLLAAVVAGLSGPPPVRAGAAGADTRHAPTGIDGTRNVIMLVGDSVPKYMWRAFEAAATTYGYHVVSATVGSCPATGALVVDENGIANKSNCPKAVPLRQNAVLKHFRPALVIWWSRYEVADRRWPDGTQLLTGSQEYWRAQQLAFQRRVNGLTSLGGKVVAVEIERLGIGVNDRCERLTCGPLIRRLAFETAIPDRWNWFLEQHRGRTVFSISINDAVCHDQASPCNDRLANGELARLDGVHYVPAAKPAVARRIVRAALRVSGLGSAPAAPRYRNRL